MKMKAWHEQLTRPTQEPRRWDFPAAPPSGPATPHSNRTAYFLERGVTMSGTIIESNFQRVTIKMPYSGRIYHRRWDQIHSNPGRVKK